MAAIAAVSCLAAALVPASAAAEASCILSDIVRDEARAATVRPGASRTYFVKDDLPAQGCPNASTACRARAYLRPGDTVLTGHSHGVFTCVGFANPKGVPTVDWLPSAVLAPAPAAEQAPADLLGHWVGPEQDLTIKRASAEAMAVEGKATWGMGDAWRREHGSVHTGAIAGTARLQEGALAFTMGTNGETLLYSAGEPEDCRVRLQRRGPYLIVLDNNACGGANVTFTGLYSRKR